jgi:hypothetical protein
MVWVSVSPAARVAARQTHDSAVSKLSHVRSAKNARLLSEKIFYQQSQTDRDIFSWFCRILISIAKIIAQLHIHTELRGMDK